MGILENELGIVLLRGELDGKGFYMIGVFGGTFNPVHNAHIHLALEVHRLLELDHVRMIPCGIPAHREQPNVSPSVRMSLLISATKEHPELVPDDLELTRSGPSYMVDTLQFLKVTYPDTLCLILGVDAYNTLDSWRKWRTILDLSHIVVMRRPLQTASKACSDELLEYTRMRTTVRKQDLYDNAFGKVLRLKNTEFNMSSSILRKKLALGQSTENMLPDTVCTEILNNALYKKN